MHNAGRQPDAYSCDVVQSGSKPAIDVAVYLLAFGRYLALAREELSELGVGGLLMDAGKLRLPTELLDKATPCSPAEHSLIKKHVAFGESMVHNLRGVCLTLSAGGKTGEQALPSPEAECAPAETRYCLSLWKGWCTVFMCSAGNAREAADGLPNGPRLARGDKS